MITLEDVFQLVVDALQLDEDNLTLTADTQLLGAIPEFDSMAVVTVITAAEENFDLVVDDDEITAEVFETFGSLHEFLAGLDA